MPWAAPCIAGPSFPNSRTSENATDARESQALGTFAGQEALRASVSPTGEKMGAPRAWSWGQARSDHIPGGRRLLGNRAAGEDSTTDERESMLIKGNVRPCVPTQLSPALGRPPRPPQGPSGRGPDSTTTPKMPRAACARKGRHSRRPMGGTEAGPLRTWRPDALTATSGFVCARGRR